MTVVVLGVREIAGLMTLGVPGVEPSLLPVTLGCALSVLMTDGILGSLGACFIPAATVEVLALSDGTGEGA